MADKDGHWAKGPDGEPMPAEYRIFIPDGAMKLYLVWKAVDNLKNALNTNGNSSPRPELAKSYYKQLREYLASYANGARNGQDLNDIKFSKQKSSSKNRREQAELDRLVPRGSPTVMKIRGKDYTLRRSSDGGLEVKSKAHSSGWIKSDLSLLKLNIAGKVGKEG